MVVLVSSGCPGGLLETFWCYVGCILGPSWAHIGLMLGSWWAHVGLMLGHVGAMMELCWIILRYSGNFGSSCINLCCENCEFQKSATSVMRITLLVGWSFQVGAMLGLCWVCWGYVWLCWAMLGILEPRWGILGPSWLQDAPSSGVFGGFGQHVGVFLATC